MSSDSPSVDKYGFLSTLNSIQSIDLHKSCARLAKWETMLSNWDYYMLKHSSKLKSRIRKGIPQSLRGRVWTLLSEIDVIRQSYPKNYYTHLTSLELQRTVDSDIKNDLDRTYPTHIKFREEEGQKSLFRVLKAYAILDPEVSYTQGMSFIAGMFLLFTNEEEAFWMLVVLMFQNDFRRLFIQGMPKLYNCFYVANGLLRHFDSKIFWKLRQENVSIPLFAVQWFLTGYSSFFDIETTLRIWDCFWFEGFKVFYRVFLAIFSFQKKEILAGRYERILMSLNKANCEIETEDLINKAFRISLKSKLIMRLDMDYRKGPKQKYIDWVSVKIN